MGRGAATLSLAACAALTWAALDARLARASEDGPTVGLFFSAQDSARQGFIRVINHSGRAGDVWIDAYDDTGRAYGGTIGLAVGASRTVHFNSDDLELGNRAKGLSNFTGFGEGDWRQEFASDLDVEVLAYARSPDGFLTSFHDTVPRTPNGHRVAIFNPGSNRDQVSRLRVVNTGPEPANVGISGVDDAGDSPGTEVTAVLPAGAARTISARELEHGADGLVGALGDGVGKWRLTVSSDQPLLVMSLLESPEGHMTNLSTVPSADAAGVRHVPLFPAASDRVREGFVRLVNLTSGAGEAAVVAFDDRGDRHGPLTVALRPDAVVHFNSADLESGNADKGLSGATGTGAGAWRLEVTSDLEIDVLSYIRTPTGFLTAMHDLAPGSGPRYRVAIFNPGSNRNQQSRLRLANPGSEDASVSIVGIDDRGAVPGGGVTLTVPARAARTLTAHDLETGGEGFDGNIGNGAGKWQLTVDSDREILVMSLLASPTGHLTNLSTTPREP